MNIYHNNQSQFELFPGDSDGHGQKQKLCSFRTKVIFSIENCIVLGIVAIIGLVLSFSLGVERGKKRDQVAKSQLADLQQEEVVAAEVQEIAVVVPEIEERVAALPVVGQATEDPGPETVVPAVEEFQKKKVDKSYTIQVASFKSEAYAKKEAMNLKKLGYEKIMVLPKGKYSIVCIGEFAQKDEAKSGIR